VRGGGGLVLTWASWSVIFGIQMPPQSGSWARSAQSLAVGGELTGGLSPSAARIESVGNASAIDHPVMAITQRSIARSIAAICRACS
jgi:hypothetical protein